MVPVPRLETEFESNRLVPLSEPANMLSTQYPSCAITGEAERFVYVRSVRIAFAPSTYESRLVTVVAAFESVDEIQKGSCDVPVPPNFWTAPVATGIKSAFAEFTSVAPVLNGVEALPPGKYARVPKAGEPELAAGRRVQHHQINRRVRRGDLAESHGARGNRIGSLRCGSGADHRGADCQKASKSDREAFRGEGRKASARRGFALDRHWCRDVVSPSYVVHSIFRSSFTLSNCGERPASRAGARAMPRSAWTTARLRPAWRRCNSADRCRRPW